MELGIQLSGGVLALHEKSPGLDEWKERKKGGGEERRKEGKKYCENLTRKLDPQRGCISF